MTVRTVTQYCTLLCFQMKWVQWTSHLMLPSDYRLQFFLSNMHVFILFSNYSEELWPMMTETGTTIFSLSPDDGWSRWLWLERFYMFLLFTGHVFYFYWTSEFETLSHVTLKHKSAWQIFRMLFFQYCLQLAWRIFRNSNSLITVSSLNTYFFKSLLAIIVRCFYVFHVITQLPCSYVAKLRYMQ